MTETCAALEETLSESTILFLTMSPSICIPLVKLINRGVCQNINRCISNGKEAYVYHATKADGKELAIKVYIDSPLFMDTYRYENGDYDHLLLARKQTANKMEIEMKYLMRLKAAGIRCPTAYSVRPRVLVMEFIGKDGYAAPLLKDAALSLEKLREGYVDMIIAMRTLYQKCKLVHGDLSESNVLYFEGHLYIIDVSQSVDLDHPSSSDFLLEDCLRVSDFFKEHGVAVMSIRELFDFIVDPTSTNDKADRDGEYGDAKRFPEPYFLRRILCCEDMGNDFSVTKLVYLAVHAVFLEFGFVGFDSMYGLRVDLFYILKKEASTTTAVSYTLPQLLLSNDDNVTTTTESIVLNFQSVGDYVNVYGSLAKTKSSTSHELNIEKIRYVPAIGSLWGADRLNEEDMDSGCIAYNAEKVIFEFWKFVKDGLALPLLMDLCEKTGLELPPCLIKLPSDLMLQILELLPGWDIGRLACVCKEMSYLSSNNKLWKQKYMSQFGNRRTRAPLTPTTNWKTLFASSWKKTTKT
ncbi:Serine/threonine-protein kinase Rio1 [Euphorbia peplus]|nr:Serine/threonine-protein kinase Rio1 [Euphorbia peplus]